MSPGEGPAPEEAGVGGSYPAELECDVLLSDGRTARLRAIRPDDGPALRAFGGKLSKETVYLRFFSPRRRISDEEITHLVTVDYQDRLALVALIDGELVAVARYDHSPEPSRETGAGAPARTSEETVQESVKQAEVAFVVRDDHQGRGLGTVLLEHLASAAVERGIGRFVADTLPENHRMIGVFRSAGFDEHALLESGVVRVTMDLAARPEYLERVEDRESRATVRSIERILRPSSVAVVEASPEPGSAGHDIVRNLLAGKFAGAIHPVNPEAVSVEGLPAYRSVADVPGPVDLALIAAPPPLVADVVRDCGGKGVGGLVIVTAGSPELAGREERDRDLVGLARNYGMRLVGPNSVGVINTAADVRMNASFAGLPPSAGRVAFSSQSGGLGIALLGELESRGLGISSFVSVGDKADVSGNDLLRFWEEDPETGVILLYLESFGNPRKFSRVARRLARTKPIVAVKSARTTAGLRGAHARGGGAVPDQAADALFRQAGVIRVGTLEELLDVADLLANQPLPAGRRVAIVGNAGGCGVLAADACESQGLEVPELALETQRRLTAAVSTGAATGNPVDLVASATATEYRLALEILLADEEVDAVIVTFTPPAPGGAAEVAAAVATVAAEAAKPVLANFVVNERTQVALGGGSRRVPWFPYPESAARALARVAPYAEWVKRPEGTVPAFSDLDVARAARIIAAGLASASSESSVWLDTIEAFELLKAYGIPILSCRRVATPAEAVEGAEATGYPVALKLDDPSVVHKSDVGGVRLGLGSPADVTSAAEALLTSFGPGASLLVLPMGPDGVETVVGLVEDPSFGPLVMFGIGGKEAELLSDRMWSLVPMTDEDADDLVSGLRSSPLLTGYRGSAPVDLTRLSEVLSRVARLAEDFPEVVELSLNPVVASPWGVMALDARVRVAAAVHPSPLVRRVMRTA